MKDLFQLLKQKKLSPNGYYLLYCLDSNIEFGEFDLPVPKAAELFKLKQTGLIDESGNISMEGKLVVIEATKLYLRQVKSIKDELDDDYKSNVEKYRDLFPAGVVEGKRLKSTSSELTARFIWFFKSFPQFSWNTVLGATADYIESKAQEMKFCRNASYFIKKSENGGTISDLASWCEAYDEEKKENEKRMPSTFNKLL